MIYALLTILLSMHLNLVFSIPVDEVAQRLSNILPNSIQYSLKSTPPNPFNMDCFKMIKTATGSEIGIFHSSIGMESGYNGLYSAEKVNGLWTMKSRLSTRGSQGYISEVGNGSAALFVMYELQNHERGNTIAIRYYKSKDQLFSNNFLYEYQLIQQNSLKAVRNIGTPSLTLITLTRREFDSHLSAFNISIKYHYSPEGSTDWPGYGWIKVDPIVDFVDGKGQWIGGCKQKYTGWRGITDDLVLAAIRKIGFQGKIGQRDLFELPNTSGKLQTFYIYEVNLYQHFDWHNWRIILYSEKENKAYPIPFNFDKVIDVANPHISLISFDTVRNKIVFWMSFFLPSEGMIQGSKATAGEMSCEVQIQL